MTLFQHKFKDKPPAALGIDVGSTTTKLVAVDADGQLVWSKLEQADPRVGKQVDEFLAAAQKEAHAPEDATLVATGYGRKLVTRVDKQITEITCHAKGVFRELGHGGTLIDIGGQDSKVIILAADGTVMDFSMNDKCAAGTGRFLEHSAQRLRIPIEELGNTALATKQEVPISSTCTVFAESEIISLIARGIEVEQIVRSLHRSLIKRVVSMVKALGLRPPLMLSGGVVKNPAVQAILEEEIGEKVILPEYPQLMGAYGAALLALEMQATR